MTGLLTAAVKKNHLGRSANSHVYGFGIGHEDVIWVSNYMYSYGDLQRILGFENLNFMQSNFLAEIMAQLRHVGPRHEMGSTLG